MDIPSKCFPSDLPKCTQLNFFLQILWLRWKILNEKSSCSWVHEKLYNFAEGTKFPFILCEYWPMENVTRNYKREGLAAPMLVTPSITWWTIFNRTINIFQNLEEIIETIVKIRRYFSQWNVYNLWNMSVSCVDCTLFLFRRVGTKVLVSWTKL